MEKNIACSRPGSVTSRTNPPPVLFTVDVEDWFHSENLPLTERDWNSQVPRVSENVKKMLLLLNERQIKGTFFVLGWVAEKYPHLVGQIHREGHEIACHGYNHRLIYKMTQKEFRADIKKSKSILEAITGEAVLGYRASNFSITDWAINILQEEGFVYDSSSCMVSMHDRYGKLTNYELKHGRVVYELERNFWEVSVSVLKMAGMSIPWGGGGYFRLFPYNIFKLGVNYLLGTEGLYIFYIHPRDIDPGQPYLNNTSCFNRFRQYTGIKKCEAKLKNFLNDFTFISMRDYLAANFFCPNNSGTK